MEDLFNMLSSSARIDKSKRKKKKTKIPINNKIMHQSPQDDEDNNSDDDDTSINSTNHKDEDEEPKKKRPKKQHSTKKLKQIHNEEIAAFRRRMGIRISNDNKHEMNVNLLDPISSFKDWKCPSWWSMYGSDNNNNSMKGDSSENSNNNKAMKLFNNIHQTILTNIEYGKWNEPTPIQMQSLPSLMERRDVMGCAPTGSGKSGAFILPLIMIGKCSEEIYYNQKQQQQKIGTADNVGDEKMANNEDKKRKKKKKKSSNSNLQGQIRTILLAPSRELASQLHREIIRLSTNIPNGKFTCITLSKSNVGLAISNTLGSGNTGLDCLVSTPLRLVECLERGMKLNGVRLLVLDEADRLLDASDGHSSGSNNSSGNDKKKKWKKDTKKKHDDDVDDSDNEDESEEEEDTNINNTKQQSGSSQSRTFLQQIDSILANIPNSATRALFSATLGPSVRHLSESILRSPIDISTGIHAKTGGNSAAGGVASEYIQQELKFVGREEGKLLAIRQLVSQGIKPPVLIFMQSKDRAQALFGELLYDGIHVDVIHAGRSHSHRELAVQKFRRGETWVLICTDLVARGVDFKAVNLVINYDLPSEGVTYVHRIGRTGRAGRQGRAITFFTEADFDNLRTIANVMRLSGCVIPQWMLNMKKSAQTSLAPKRRGDIDTTPRYDKKKRRRSGNKK